MDNCLTVTKRGYFVLISLCSIFMLSLPGAIAAEKTPAADPAPEVSTLALAPAGPADLLYLYQLARKNDPTFQRERYRYDNSPEILKQARSDLMPSIALDLYYSQSSQEIYDTDVAVYGESSADFPSQGYNLHLNQPVFEYATYKRFAQAKEEVKQAEFEFQAAKQDLLLRVAEAYIEALAANDNFDFTQAEEEGLRFHFELAQERFNSGLAPVTDYHDAKARYAYVTAKTVRAEYELNDALEALAGIAGERFENLARLKFTAASPEAMDGPPAGKQQTLEIDLEPAIETIPLAEPEPNDIDAWIASAYDQNFQILIQKQRVLIAEREIERQKGGHYPSLEFIARTVRDDTGGSLYGGSSDVGKDEFLFQMNVPLYEGGSVSSKTRQARNQLAAAEEEMKKERRAVRRETMAAFLGVKGSIKNAIALSQSVVSTQIALRAKREGYKSGLFPSLVVSDAERDHYLAKRDFAKAQYEYIGSSLRLKRAVGTLQENDLIEINQWLQ